MMMRYKNILFIGLICLGIFWINSAYAVPADIVQDIDDAFRAQTQRWFGPIQSYAMWLLFSLALISMIWTGALLLLRGADFQEFVTELVRMVMFIGFFSATIIYAPTWSRDLIDGFMFISNQATGSIGSLNAAGILERGFILANAILEASGPLSFFPYLLIAGTALILYALIAAFVFMVMAEMYILVAAGIILLGFGGSVWTSDYAKRYITYCVSVGLKLYIIFLVVGLGEQFVYDWAIDIQKDEVSNALSIVGVLVLLTILVKMVPDMAQSIVNGSSIGRFTPSVGSIAQGTAKVASSVASKGVGAAAAVQQASKIASNHSKPNTLSHIAGTASNLAKGFAKQKQQEMLSQSTLGRAAQKMKSENKPKKDE